MGGNHWLVVIHYSFLSTISIARYLLTMFKLDPFCSFCFFFAFRVPARSDLLVTSCADWKRETQNGVSLFLEQDLKASLWFFSLFLQEGGLPPSALKSGSLHFDPCGLTRTWAGHHLWGIWYVGSWEVLLFSMLSPELSVIQFSGSFYHQTSLKLGLKWISGLSSHRVQRKYLVSYSDEPRCGRDPAAGFHWAFGFWYSVNFGSHTSNASRIEPDHLLPLLGLTTALRWAFELSLFFNCLNVSLQISGGGSSDSTIMTIKQDGLWAWFFQLWKMLHLVIPKSYSYTRRIFLLSYSVFWRLLITLSICFALSDLTLLLD